MEIIGADTDHGMRMLVHLAFSEQGTPVSARVLSQAQNVPLAFARKILQKLTNEGITGRSFGPNGGFVLSRSPQQISLLNVVEAIQGPVVLRKCCLGLNSCDHIGSCLVTTKLGLLQSSLTADLKGITLADVIASKSPKAKQVRPDTKKLKVTRKTKIIQEED